jgi:putative glutamine amidotransferase
MARPVVGIIGNSYLINDQYPTHAGGTMNAEAVAHVSGCLPMLIPTDPRFVSVDELLEVCDGFVLTGGRPNVHPEEYGEAETEAHGAFDRARDAVTLPLVRACVDRGQPFLGICRGFQEINVALGGSLHPEIRDLPGRMNHRMPPDGTLEEKFALRHPVRFTENGPFHKLFGATEVMTNTLHGQGIKQADFGSAKVQGLEACSMELGEICSRQCQGFFCRDIDGCRLTRLETQGGCHQRLYLRQAQLGDGRAQLNRIDVG